MNKYLFKKNFWNRGRIISDCEVCNKHKEKNEEKH